MKTTQMEVYSNNTTEVLAMSGNKTIKALRVRQKQGNEKIRLHVCNDGNLLKGFELTMDELKNKVFKVKNYGLSINSCEMQQLIFNIESQYQDFVVLDEVENIGLQMDDNGEITGYVGVETLKLNGDLCLKDIQGRLPDSKGDLGIYMKKANEIISKNVIRQAIFIYGLSSVIAGILNKTLLLNLVGTSSTGKTTMARLMLSLFSSPDFEKTSKTFSATDAYLVKALGAIRGMTVLIDDLSLMPNKTSKNLTSLIYMLESGIEKGRLVKGNELCERSEWATTICMTSEESMLKNCNPEQEGIVGRLMEIAVFDDDLFDGADECNEIQKLFSENYGLAGIEFVRYILKKVGIDKLKDMYMEEIKLVRQDVDNDEVMLRMAENIAIVTLTGKLANVVFGLDMDVSKVQGYLLSVQRENIENFRAMQSGNVILKKVYPILLEYGKNVCTEYIRGNKILIDSKSLKPLFQNIKADFGYKAIEIKTELKKAGLLDINDSTFSHVATINGKSVRGLCVIEREGE